MIEVIVKLSDSERSFIFREGRETPFLTSPEDPFLRSLIEKALVQFGSKPDDVDIKIKFSC